MSFFRDCVYIIILMGLLFRFLTCYADSIRSRGIILSKWMVFTEDTQVGISGSLVTPIGKECRNVFNAFVVETNYNVPIAATEFYNDVNVRFHLFKG